MTLFNTPFTTEGNYTQSDPTAIEFTGTTARLQAQPENAYAHYHLNESSGTTVTDSSGNARTGTFQGTATWVSGKLSNAADFDGSSGLKFGSTDFDFDVGDSFTFEGWFKSNTKTAASTIWSKKTVSPNTGYIIYVDGSGYVSVVMDDNGSANRITKQGSTDVVDNTWRHIVISYDGSNSHTGVKIYVNGIEETYSVGTDVGTRTTFLNSAEFNIGMRDNTQNYLIGQIDETAIFDKVLTLAQIQERYNSGIGTENLPTSDNYVTNRPTIYKTAGDSTTNVSAWDSFSAIESGTGSIGYQLSTTGSDWLYWSGAAWVDSVGTTNYNSSTVVDTNIVSFPTDFNQIFTRVLFISDGTQQPVIDNIDIGYFSNTQPSVYAGPDIPLAYGGVNAGDSTTPFKFATIQDVDTGDTVTAHWKYGAGDWTLIGTTGSTTAVQTSVRAESILFSTSGVHTLSLRITDSYSSTATDSLNISVNGYPTITGLSNIGLQYNGIDEGDSTTPFQGVTLSDEYGGTTVETYYKVPGEVDTWTLISSTGRGDDCQSSTESFTYQFDNYGLKTVLLKSVDTYGAETTTSMTVDVNAYPTISALSPVTAHQNQTVTPFHSVTLSDTYGGSVSSTYYKIPSIVDTWTYIGQGQSAVQSLSFVATTYGDYTIHLQAYDTFGAASESTTTYQINAVPLISGLSNFNVLDNTSTTPFASIVLSDPDGSVVKTQYKVIGEVDTWTDVSTTGNIQQGTRDFVYQFNNPGTLTVWLLTEDNEGATTADSISVGVNYATVTFNILDSLGNNLSNIIFFSDLYDSTAGVLKNSPFTHDYEVGTYDPLFRIPGYVDETINYSVSLETQSTTVTMNKILTDTDIPGIIDDFLNEVLDSTHRTENSLGWWMQVVGGLMGVNMTSRPNAAEDLTSNDIKLFDTSTQAQANYDNEATVTGNWFRVQTSQAHGATYITKYLRKTVNTT